MEWVIGFVGVLVGGVISFFSGWGLQYLAEKRREQDRKKYFCKIILDDLKRSKNFFSILSTTWQEKNQVDFRSVTQLIESRQEYKKFRENIIYFPKNIRDELYDYYSSSEYVITALSVTQQRIIHLRDEFIRTVRVQMYSGIDEQDAIKNVKAFMDIEEQDILDRESEIQEMVTQLESINTDIDLIIKMLN